MKVTGEIRTGIAVMIVAFHALAILLTGGCTHSTEPSARVLVAAFAIEDSAGRPISQIHSGETFRVTFTLVNTTEDTLTYTRGNTGPPVIFRIVQEDSIVASSTDGYAFLQVVLGGCVAPGQSLHEVWNAPTTPAQYPKVVLGPGGYEASVSFATFPEARVNPVSPIGFIVIP
jgi:hypothetical protein